MSKQVNKKGIKANGKEAKKSEARGRRSDRASRIDSESSRTAVREVSSADNDPAWYALTPALLRDAASIPFSNALGLKFPLGRSEKTLPGICGLGIDLVPGTSDFADSPLNVASRNIYSWVRHANSGSRNYDSPNLMMYILAMDSLYSVYSHCARMYGLIRVYAQKNRYYPKAFFDIIGWDYDDFVRNQAAFRLWLNTFVQKVGSMCVPSKMTYQLRHMWMFQNIWLDGMTEKAQSYFMYPTHVMRYTYDASSSEYPIQLRESTILGTENNKLTVNALATIVDSAIQTIMSSEDLAIMSGDILKAYGPSGIWRLVPIHEDLVVLPTYSQEVMYQIHNALVLPAYRVSLIGDDDNVTFCRIAEYADAATGKTYLKTVVGRDMEQSAGQAATNAYEMAFATIRSSGGIDHGSVLLDFHHQDISPEDVMVGSRLTPALEVTVQDATHARCLAFCGSEFVSRLTIVSNPATETGIPSTPYGIRLQEPSQYFDREYITRKTADGSYAAFPSSLASLFNFFPAIYTLTAPSSSSFVRSAVECVHGQLENYAPVSTTVLKNMHLAALMSELSVPQMGAITG